MYGRILFPTDGSDGASAVFEHVLDVADRYDATVHVLNVADTTRDSIAQLQGEVVDVLEDEGERIVREAADRARTRGVDVVTEVVQGEPYRTIVDYADSRGVDLVALPTHGRRGLERFLLGSTTERVVRRSNVPVLVIRPDDEIEYPYRDVLVPTDGSDCATEALELGVRIATAEDARLHLLSVVSLPNLGVDTRSEVQRGSMEQEAREVVDAAAAYARDAGVESVVEAVEGGTSIPGTIRSYVEENDVDLLVVGTHGRTGFDRYVLGSVTENLVRTAPVPVLTVREGDATGAGE